MPKTKTYTKKSDQGKAWNRSKGSGYKVSKIETRETVLIVCEGQTEKVYFESFPIRTLTVNVVDLGGQSKTKLVEKAKELKKKVNDRFGWNLSSVDAIKWAMIDRNTTKTGITGGIGLAILKEFIMKNKGMMQIVSDDGFYQFGHGGETTALLTGRFPGTVVNLEFKTDDSCSYSLKSEIDKKNIF